MEANECSARISDQSAPPCHGGEEEMNKSQLSTDTNTQLSGDFFFSREGKCSTSANGTGLQRQFRKALVCDR